MSSRQLEHHHYRFLGSGRGHMCPRELKHKFQLSYYFIGNILDLFLFHVKSNSINTECIQLPTLLKDQFYRVEEIIKENATSDLILTEKKGTLGWTEKLKRKVSPFF